MTDEQSRAAIRLAELQRDEALRTLASVREEVTRALETHRANELDLANKIRDTESRLAQARDTITHMERSFFWRLRGWILRLRRNR